MKSIRFLSLLSTLFAVVSASITHGGGRDIDLHDDVNEDEKIQRELSGLTGRGLLTTATCPSPGSTVFFNVKTVVIPGLGARSCGDANLEAIGNMINSALIKAGVSIYSGSIFLAGTCDTPTTGSSSMIKSLLNGSIRRKLQAGFIWTGGGVSCTNLIVCTLNLQNHANTSTHCKGCRKCGSDNKDGRSLLITSSLLSLFFTSKSDIMETAIEAEVKKGLVNYPCMGSKPSVYVTVEVVRLWNLSLQCPGDFITTGLLGL